MEPEMFPRYQRLIEQRIQSGQNRDTLDVIHEALELLDVVQMQGMPTRPEIDEAREAVAAGRFQEWSPEYGTRLMREAQEQVKQRQRLSTSATGS